MVSAAESVSWLPSLKRGGTAEQAGEHRSSPGEHRSSPGELGFAAVAGRRQPEAAVRPRREREKMPKGSWSSW